MFEYASKFDKDQIPHISANNEIVDNIHNYNIPKAQPNSNQENRSDLPPTDFHNP